MDNREICDLSWQLYIKIPIQSVLGKSEFVPPSGHLHFEYKKGKWHKRSFTVKDNGIYLSRDSKVCNPDSNPKSR